MSNPREEQIALVQKQIEMVEVAAGTFEEHARLDPSWAPAAERLQHNLATWREILETLQRLNVH